MSAGGWRLALADALDEQAGDIRRTLAELDNVHELLEARDVTRVCTELRGLAASLRSEASTIENEARSLRADAADVADDGTPRGLPAPPTTTHHPRRSI